MKNNIIIFGLMISFALMSFSGTVVFAEEIPVEVTEEISDEIVPEEEMEEKPVLKLSLQDAIDYALENSKDMEIVRLELLKAEVVYNDNIRGIDRGEDNLQYISVRDAFGRVIPDAVVNKAFIRNGGARLATELSFDTAKWNVEMKENEVRYNVEKAYFDLLQIEKELKIAEDNLALAQEQYDHAKLRYEVGMISQQQLLGLEFSLSQAQSSHETARMYYGLQKMSFRNTLGMDFDREFKLIDAIEVKEYEEINLEHSIELAFENNGSLKIVEGNVEVANLNLQALSGRYPDITYVYRAQSVDVAKAEKNLETVRAGVEMQVRSAVVNLTTAEKQIATFEKAVYQASEGVRIAELSFELGQNTPTEVAQANLNLMNAKKNLAQQIHAFNMALLDYKYSIGIGKGF